MAPDTDRVNVAVTGALRRFSDIYIPLRKLSINSADPAPRGILRALRNFGQATDHL
jgi:hypothetical protein